MITPDNFNNFRTIVGLFLLKFNLSFILNLTPTDEREKESKTSSLVLIGLGAGAILLGLGQCSPILRILIGNPISYIRSDETAALQNKKKTS